MPPRPPQDPPAAFAEHGWIVVREAVAPDRVAALAAAFDALLPPGAAPPPEVRQLPGAGARCPALLAHLGEAGLGPLLAALLGARAVRLLQDALLLKPPGAGEITWHQDATYTGYLDPGPTLSVRLALGPETEDGGCLRVIDGSHRWGPLGAPRVFADDLGRSALEALPPPLAARAAAATVALPLAPGDVTVHGGWTLHASGPNRTDRPRRTVVAHVFDAACRLVPGRLPPGAAAARFPTDADGRLTDAACPVVFRAGP